MGQRFFSLSRRPDQLWGPLSILSNKYRWHLSRGHESRRTRNQVWRCWRGQASIFSTRPAGVKSAGERRWPLASIYSRDQNIWMCKRISISMSVLLTSCLSTGRSYKFTFPSVFAVLLDHTISTEFVLKSIIFWDVTPCTLLSCNRRFGGTYRLPLQGRRNNFSKNQQVSNMNLFYFHVIKRVWVNKWEKFRPTRG
jgi:hypothetical protein